MKITFEKRRGIDFPLYDGWRCLRCDQIVLGRTRGLKPGQEIMPMHTEHCPFRYHENTDAFRDDFYLRKRSAKEFLPPKRRKPSKADRFPELKKA